jgi:parvulin-like peptidyl-prolyl isomerase
LQIRLKATTGAIIGVRDAISELRSFAADITTFRHCRTPQLRNIAFKQSDNLARTGYVPSNHFLRRSRFVFNFKRKFLIPVIVFTSLFIAACNGNSGGGDGDAVAKVGSKEIKMSEVDRVIKQQLAQSPTSATFNSAQLANARLAVLDRLIEEEALFQRAKKDNLVPDDNKVNQEIQKRKQEAGITDDQYKEQLKQIGISEEEAKEQIRRSLAIEAWRDKEKTRVAQPTDEEVKKYFEDNKDQFRAVRGVDFSITATAPANNGGDAGAETKIKAIYEQLKSGTDFATLASQRSEDQNTAIRGGNVGFLSEDQLKQGFPGRQDVVDKLMKELTPGQYTPPLRDNGTGVWAIFKLNARREKEEPLTLENPEVRKGIVDNLTQQRQQVLFSALVVTALSESNAKNYLAEQLVQDPNRISAMKPSALLQQAAQQQPQQPQPQPRVENQNAAPANSNAASTSKNVNTTPANRPANSNK